MKKTMLLLIMMLATISMSIASFADEYTVKSGDVLWKIARDNDISLKQLIKMNTFENPNKIYPGDVIIISEDYSNNEKVLMLLESIENGNQEPVSFINPQKYIQHNLAVKDGLAGFGELLSQLPEGSAKVNVKRVFTDGDYVFAHTDYNFFGPKIGFDIFRFEDGLIVEHWDNLAAKSSDTNPSGRTQIDGYTKLEDIKKTEENKTIVKNFVYDVLMGNNPDKITSYVSTKEYIQHNTGIADGLDGLGKAIADMKEAGLSMTYEKNHMILGQGNFVLSVSEGEFMGKKVSYYDMFRIEDGLIVEHWDTIEEIPTKDKHMNKNGKF